MANFTIYFSVLIEFKVRRLVTLESNLSASMRNYKVKQPRQFHSKFLSWKKYF